MWRQHQVKLETLSGGKPHNFTTRRVTFIRGKTCASGPRTNIHSYRETLKVDNCVEIVPLSILTNLVTNSDELLTSDEVWQQRLSFDEVDRNCVELALLQCCTMLDCLGVAYVQAQGEAEAMCAFLNKHGVRLGNARAPAYNGCLRRYV